jgi:hypothetical protein
MKTLYNFLDSSTIDMAKNEVDYLRSSTSMEVRNSWRSSNLHWPKSLTEGAVIGTVSHAFCSDDLKDRVINLIKPHVPGCNKISVQHYLWHPLSGINMHPDGGTIFGATIYLTPEWSINWGGLFVYKDSNVLRVNFPHFNSININTDQTGHMVTTVSPLAPYPRHTLQIWGHYET